MVGLIMGLFNSSPEELRREGLYFSEIAQEETIRRAFRGVFGPVTSSLHHTYALDGDTKTLILELGGVEFFRYTFSWSFLASKDPDFLKATEYIASEVELDRRLRDLPWETYYDPMITVWDKLRGQQIMTREEFLKYIGLPKDLPNF